MSLNTPGTPDGPTEQPLKSGISDTSMTDNTEAMPNPNPTPARKLRSKAQQEPVQNASKKIRSAPSALVLAKHAKKDYSAPVGRRVQTVYPVGRPKGKFLRVHPDNAYRQAGVLTYKDPDNPDDVYYVSPDLQIPDEYGVSLSVADLYAGVSHDGTYFVWNVNRSDTPWYRSAQKAVTACVGHWFKVVGRKGPNIYDLYEPADPNPPA